MSEIPGRMPPHVREEFEREMRKRWENGQSVEEILTWLGSPHLYNPTAGQALHLVKTALGLSPEEAEHALRADTEWGRLMRLMDPSEGAAG